MSEPVTPAQTPVSVLTAIIRLRQAAKADLTVELSDEDYEALKSDSSISNAHTIEMEATQYLKDASRIRRITIKRQDEPTVMSETSNKPLRLNATLGEDSE
jgi:hypothetical protein